MAIVWLSWCLYWPYFALHQNAQAAIREADETRKVCFQQPGLTPVDCDLDHRLYKQRLLQATMPSGRSAYQSFAGQTAEAVIGFMSALIAIPLLALYVTGRLSLGAYRLVARAIR